MKGFGKSGKMPSLWIRVRAASLSPGMAQSDGTRSRGPSCLRDLVLGLETLHLCWAGLALLQLPAAGSCSAFSMLLKSFWQSEPDPLCLCPIGSWGAGTADAQAVDVTCRYVILLGFGFLQAPGRSCCDMSCSRVEGSRSSCSSIPALVLGRAMGHLAPGPAA